MRPSLTPGAARPCRSVASRSANSPRSRTRARRRRSISGASRSARRCGTPGRRSRRVSPLDLELDPELLQLTLLEVELDVGLQRDAGLAERHAARLDELADEPR